MVKILTEEEAKKAKEKLEKGMKHCLSVDNRGLSDTEINWQQDITDWDKIKSQTRRYIRREVVAFDELPRLFFVAHDKDEIKGKPQLIQETMQRIPLVRRIKKIEKGRGKEKDRVIVNIKFIGEQYDKRYDGQETNHLAFDFWVYRVIDSGKEHYVFSMEKLPTEYCVLRGMQINVDDRSEFSNTLRLNKITSIFFVSTYEPSVKALEKEALVEYVKKAKVTKDDFLDYLFAHPNGKIYDYSEDFNLLRAAQLLSGKYEGYPLHLMKMGPVGTGKTTEAEVLDAKFQEEKGILEAANSTLKVLVPSFKEKPANLGYIVKCNRISIIDELMKMVEKDAGHDAGRLGNYFGQMNMLLEHKLRSVGSGNDNETVIQATAKVCITTNNFQGKNTIYSHIGLVDATTLSRMLIWVQDAQEIQKIYNNEGVRKVKSPPHIDNPPLHVTRVDPPTPPQDPVSRACLSVGGSGNEGWLTIYDSCQQFLVDFDEERCDKIYQVITNLAKEPMKQVWRSRGRHHTVLLLDGLTKFRCLFEDYDSTFIPKERDYELLERILVHMVKGWDTNLGVASWENL